MILNSSTPSNLIMSAGCAHGMRVMKCCGPRRNEPLPKADAAPITLVVRFVVYPMSQRLPAARAGSFSGRFGTPSSQAKAELPSAWRFAVCDTAAVAATSSIPRSRHETAAAPVVPLCAHHPLQRTCQSVAHAPCDVPISTRVRTPASRPPTHR